MKRPIGEPSAATWTIDGLFVKISAKGQVTIGIGRGVIPDLDPQEASKLTDMIENALRWLDRRIAQEDATPANVPHEHGKAF